MRDGAGGGGGRMIGRIGVRRAKKRGRAWVERLGGGASLSRTILGFSAGEVDVKPVTMVHGEWGRHGQHGDTATRDEREGPIRNPVRNPSSLRGPVEAALRRGRTGGRWRARAGAAEGVQARRGGDPRITAVRRPTLPGSRARSATHSPQSEEGAELMVGRMDDGCMKRSTKLP